MEKTESLEITSNFEQLLEKTLSSEAKELLKIAAKVLDSDRADRSLEEKLIQALIDSTENRRVQEILKMTLSGLARRIYFQDGMATRHSIEPLEDELFVQSYQLAIERGGNSGIAYRAYIACWAAKKAVDLEGDFVECGVYKGTLSRTIINYVGFEKLDKKFYLLDTFGGFDFKYVTEKEKTTVALEGRYPKDGTYEYVKETFQDFANVELVRGSVPDTLTQVESDKVAYLSVDMNCAEPTRAALEFFWDKLVSGAVIVCDDYAWRGYIEQREAINQFAKSKEVDVLTLPTGQGLIFKP